MKGFPISTRSEKVEWLRARPEVAALPDGQVRRALIDAGLVSSTTMTVDLHISKLREAAGLPPREEK